MLQINITTVMSMIAFLVAMIALILVILINKSLNQKINEINDLLVSKKSEEMIFNDLSKLEELTIKKPQKAITYQANRLNAITGLNATQIKILQLASTKEITTNDVMRSIDVTREHAARLLTQLYKLGYLERTNNEKPYKYIISNQGKQYLEKETGV